MSDYSLKRHFDGACARLLAERLSAVTDCVDPDEYAADVDAQVGPLELKDRVLVLARGLHERLPADYRHAVSLLTASLGPELAEGEGMFNASWYLMPVARFVEEYGLHDPEASLRAIEEITKRHTGEYAIRPYLREHPDATMTAVRRWAVDPSHNVRRLASEGIRPRLPWAPVHPAFIADPVPVIEVLDLLIDDPSPYVRKSVGNNLNDIARDHPGLAVATARRWLDGSDSERVRWIVNHGMRTLVKNGDPGALEVVGSAADPAVSVVSCWLEPPVVCIGEALTVHAEVANTGPERRSVVVDYRVTFKGRGGARVPKVFKLGRLSLGPGEKARVVKRHSFAVVRTRTYYPGVQSIQVQANGSVGDPIEFVLREPT